MPPNQVDLWIRTEQGEILCVPEYREKWGKEHIHFAVGDKYNEHVIAAMTIDKEKGARKTLAL